MAGSVVRNPRTWEWDKLHLKILSVQCLLYKQKNRLIFCSPVSFAFLPQAGGDSYSQRVCLRAVHVAEKEISKFNRVQAREKYAPLRKWFRISKYGLKQ